MSLKLAKKALKMAFLDIFYENLNFRKFENPKTLNRGGGQIKRGWPYKNPKNENGQGPFNKDERVCVLCMIQ